MWNSSLCFADVLLLDIFFVLLNDSFLIESAFDPLSEINGLLFAGEASNDFLLGHSSVDVFASRSIDELEYLITDLFRFAVITCITNISFTVYKYASD